ncbi:MAG: TonB-dependent receptor [Opitutaceae bacterium]|jgi:TonB-dependent receptor|nr:TonB-dependent receptor [Opitutaceae bacterium]
METKTSHIPHVRFLGILPTALFVAGAFVFAGSQAPAQTTATPAAPAIPAANIPAVANGAIEGTVYNAATDLPVSKARVIIEGTPRETLTSEDGHFHFDGVHAGDVTLIVSYLGFETQTATITVPASQTATHDFQIRREGPVPRARAPGAEGSVVVMERFSVVADREMAAQAIAMNEQRHAASISHILALDELPGQGFENIGDYLRFLPGVSIIDDGESAGYLSLGGFPAHMTNVSLDGGAVASTGIDNLALTGGRELSLQDVPMINVERVEITKVPTPDKPASGLGGTMNLVSQGLLGIRTARLHYSLTMNLATNDDFSFSGRSPQAAIPSLSAANKQPSFSLRAVVPAGKKLVFNAGFSKTWKQLPPDTLTEVAQWNLWEGVRFNNATVMWGDSGWPVRFEGDTEPYDPNAPEGTYPGLMKGGYPIALNSGVWQYSAMITQTQDIQAGVEIRLSQRSTLALAFRHREVREDRSLNRLEVIYGANNGGNPAYNAGVPADGDPATTTANSAATGSYNQGTNSAYNYRLETGTDHLTFRYRRRASNWSIEANGSYSHASRLRTNNDQGYATGFGTGSISGLRVAGDGINTTDSILPTSTVATKTDGAIVSPNSTDDLYLNLVRMGEYGRYITDNYEGRLDLERIFGRHFTLKAGGAFNREERDNQRELPVWRMKSGGNHPLYGQVSGDPRMVNHYDLVDTSIVSSIGGVPVSWISPVKIWNLTQDFPEYFQPYSSTETEEYSNRANLSKLLREDISAGYLRADIRLFNNRLHAAIGARYESTKVDGWVGRTDLNTRWVRDADGNRIRDEASGGYLTYPDDGELYRRMYQVRALHMSRTYGGVYPSVNINFAITPNLVARAAYARTIGRPNVGDIVAGLTLPEITEDDSIYRIRISNPGLKPWAADSFHLSFDSYHFKGGFGSIGVYRKNISNFFADRYGIVATEDELLALGASPPDINPLLETGNVEFIRKENIGDANLTGVEFSYRQDLFFLPSRLQKTQVWVNYTHLKIAGPNAEDFIGFSPDVFSAGINYIRPRFSLRLSVAYQGETKMARTGRSATSGTRTYWLMPPDTFEYQAPRTRWSLTAEYSLSRALTLFANCNDLFADDIIIYRRAADTPSYAQKYQRRTVASYVSIGVKGAF